MEILETRNLTVGYAGRIVLRDLDLSLGAGELTVLIGANGSGKSTLLRTLSGAQPALAGEVIVDGRAVKNMRPSELARRMALVLTDRRGGGGLTLSELVAIGRHPYSGFFGRLSADDRRAVADAIAAVGLSHMAQSYVAAMSDGERQKAMIARAIAQDTPLIVLDEPTAFLDVSSRFEVMELLRRQCKAGKTILLSSHDIAPSLEVADRVWAVADGCVAAGTAEELIASGTLDRVYQGVEFDSVRGDYVAVSTRSSENHLVTGNDIHSGGKSIDRG